MPRNSQSVAIELMDLVRRTAANQDRCRELLAIKLQMIYEYAYAMGCKAATELATKDAYDRGLAEGKRLAQMALPVPLPVQTAQLPAISKADSSDLLSDLTVAAGERKLLFGFMVYRS